MDIFSLELLNWKNATVSLWRQIKILLLHVETDISGFPNATLPIVNEVQKWLYVM
jgi:hypothetical protein